MTKDEGAHIKPTTAGQDILMKRMDRGDIEEEGIIYTKRGYKK